MDNNSVFESLQQNFRIAVGAATDLAEKIQDPQRREALLSGQEKIDFKEQAPAWEAKGAETEKVARETLSSFAEQASRSVESAKPGTSGSPLEFFNQFFQPSNGGPVVDAPVVSTNSVQDEASREIKLLAAEVTALREELASLKES
ncbi:MAG: hypothetical protein AAGG02_00990 [Cyanobacteria bacterium P01_H01_bin.15]